MSILVVLTWTLMRWKLRSKTVFTVARSDYIKHTISALQSQQQIVLSVVILQDFDEHRNASDLLPRVQKMPVMMSLTFLRTTTTTWGIKNPHSVSGP